MVGYIKYNDKVYMSKDEETFLWLVGSKFTNYPNSWPTVYKIRHTKFKETGVNIRNDYTLNSMVCVREYLDRDNILILNTE